MSDELNAARMATQAALSAIDQACNATLHKAITFDEDEYDPEVCDAISTARANLRRLEEARTMVWAGLKLLTMGKT